MFSPLEMYLCIKEDNDSYLNDCFSRGVSCDSVFPRDWKGENDFLSHRPSLLGIAAYYKAEKCVRSLLVQGALINIRDCIGVPLTSFAAAGGSIQIMRLLDEFGADFSGSLKFAAMFGQYSVFSWLCTNKYNQQEINLVEHGTTILHHAAKGGSAKIIRYILNETEIDVNCKTEFVFKITPKKVF